MRILLTSGGTRVPIDKVRYIMNRSHGTFGSKIAWELLKCGTPDVRLDFLSADWALTPFTVKFNAAKTLRHVAHMRVDEIYNFYDRVGYRYEETFYKDFADYAAKLEDLVRHGAYDVIVLAAAVSDYLCANYVDGKIRSDEDLSIALEHAPKLISRVKEWSPASRLVGFKLLVDSTDENLIDAATRSVELNHCEFVVANDLRDILANDHRLLVVDKDGGEVHVQQFNTNTNDPNYLARVVAQRTLPVAKLA